MINLHEKSILLQQIINIALCASKKIMHIYKEKIDVQFKGDSSPVTKADTIAHHFIMGKLKELTPMIPIISEEGEARAESEATFWLVDPLDGTKEFIQQNGEFTVNIAYIEKKQPKFGVVCAPALELLYTGIVGDKAFKIYKDIQSPIQVQPTTNDHDKVIVLGSRSHGNSLWMNEFLSKFSNNNLLAIGSSLKFCKIAEGEAHIYPRFGRTMEWDTAAGQAVLMAAGGGVYTLDGKSLLYGKKVLENPHFISCASHYLFEKGVQK